MRGLFVLPGFRRVLEHHVGIELIAHDNFAQFHRPIVDHGDRKLDRLMHGVLVRRAPLDSKVGHRMQIDRDRGQRCLVGQHIQLPLEHLDFLAHLGNFALDLKRVLHGSRGSHDLQQLTLGGLRVAHPRLDVRERSRHVPSGHVLRDHLTPVGANPLDRLVKALRREPAR